MVNKDVYIHLGHMDNNCT